ncbi:PREDICTED: cilia- and flagella-associated protein 97 [Pseudopodoces humilis]|uniref:cilia- and flagella-associated protein 97 n=1 Tax=Pseudopodoces humilis TaxID=181119 RepID=UPI000395B79F|nr:PREDICTED: cilia- and flagella-associated protein 97 [Pseudopodoces humilis]XP_014118731.1 PREDICTED: cilia- and flagella-associated protein 97 [Pseudopodoces humilis]
MDRFEDISDGEVDHAFFDSDFEEEKKKAEENGEDIEKGSTKVALADTDLVSNSKDEKCCEEESEEKQIDLHKQIDLQKDQSLENSKDSVEDASFLTLSPVAEKAGTSGAIPAANTGTEEIVPAGIPKIVKEGEEDYYTDEEDSSDDGKKQKVRLKSAKQPNNIKKASKKYTISSSSSSSSTSSSSSSSSDTDCSDTDSDSCSSDSSHSSSKRNACRNALLSPKQKFKSVMKLAEGKPKFGEDLEESEDTVTDVTPLSTPDISPIQSFEFIASNDKKLKVKRQENVNQELYDSEFDCRYSRKVLHDAMDLNQLLKAFLQLDKKEQNLTIDQSSKGIRKNYSFTNEEVRQIDRENQRLLKELSRQSARPKRSSTLKTSVPPHRLYHSALNRQKEQQRIERENLAFLKRLEAVKPTAGMRRSEQLRDYHRHMSYLSSLPSVRRGKSPLSQLSPPRGASRSSTVQSTLSQRNEKPVSDSPTGALQRPKSTNVCAAWL